MTSEVLGILCSTFCTAVFTLSILFICNVSPSNAVFTLNHQITLYTHKVFETAPTGFKVCLNSLTMFQN